MTKIQPQFDYLLCEEVRGVTGAVTQSEIADHWQKYKVLAAGAGRYQDGVLLPVSAEVGDVVYVQKHAEADSPDDLKANGLYLIMDSRVMAVDKSE